MILIRKKVKYSEIIITFSPYVVMSNGGFRGDHGQEVSEGITSILSKKKAFRTFFNILLLCACDIFNGNISKITLECLKLTFYLIYYDL